MFIHLFFGGLIFFCLSNYFLLEANKPFILLGTLMGILPDVLSYIFSFKTLNKIKTKNAHLHRDNFTHSLFFPLLIILFAFIFSNNFFLLSGLAVLTHPFLDSFGIGWGVKLFYPFNLKTYKFFYEGKLITIWKKQEEVDAVSSEKGDNEWIKNIYFRFSKEGLIEWLSLLGLIILIILS